MYACKLQCNTVVKLSRQKGSRICPSTVPPWVPRFGTADGADLVGKSPDGKPETRYDNARSLRCDTIGILILPRLRQERFCCWLHMATSALGTLFCKGVAAGSFGRVRDSRLDVTNHAWIASPRTKRKWAIVSAMRKVVHFSAHHRAHLFVCDVLVRVHAACLL